MATSKINQQPSIVKSSDWEKDAPKFLAITPLDGRNYHKIKNLSDYFSDFAFNKARVGVELNYLIFLSKHNIAPKISKTDQQRLLKVAADFNLNDASKVRDFEKITNHDVKAIEYFLKEKLTELKLDILVEFIHWGATSEDTNNLATSLNLQNFLEKEFIPLVIQTLASFTKLIKQCDYPMLGRTHGQPADITTLAKELAVFLSRMLDELERFQKIKIQGKHNGAIGSLTDQFFVHSELDWLKITKDFVHSLGLEPAIATTQILPYDSMLAIFDSIARMQQIAIDACQNLWYYISLDYFIQKRKEGEIGSSVMPQKTNPIYLEGAEGGFEIANALFSFYQRKLSRSRMQRDLSDSTVRRSFGIAFAYSYLSWQSMTEAFERISPNPLALQNELDGHCEILGSTIQNYLRTKGYTKPYEMLAKLLKNKTLDRGGYLELIKSLDIADKDKAVLQSITFANLVKPCREIVKIVLEKK